MIDMHALAHRYRGPTRLEKLVSMLQNTLRKWGPAKLWSHQGAFGVWWADGSYLTIRFSGPWSNEDMRDLLALFATWCVADPERLFPLPVEPRIGVSLTGNEQLQQSHGRES